MILKLVDGKVLINTMFVPELREHTFVQLELEPNTQHLNAVLYINDLRFTDNIINIKNEILPGKVVVKVELLDDKGIVVRTYQSKVSYNIYQVLGTKPIRPDIEQYLYNLEGEIQHLKNEIVLLDLKHKEETASLIEKFELVIEKLKSEIKTLEEKGEIV
jgi:hypothetical protein